jgi:hypothetical protein
MRNNNTDVADDAGGYDGHSRQHGNHSKDSGDLVKATWLCKNSRSRLTRQVGDGHRLFQ